MEIEYMIYFFIKREKRTTLQVHSNFKLLKAETGFCKSSDLRILLQETHLNIGSTSLPNLKKIFVKNLEILHQPNLTLPTIN